MAVLEGESLTWKYKTESKDIGFSLTFVQE